MHQSHRGARHIDGHVAAAHHNDPLAQFDFVAQVGVDQEIDAVVDPRQVRARNIQLAALVEAGGKQHRVEFGAQSAKEMSRPRVMRVCSLTPMARMLSTSILMISRGRRKCGMPRYSIPPGTGADSKTSTE